MNLEEIRKRAAAYDSLHTEISTLKAQRDELLAAAKAMSESVALLPAADGRILGLLPILCNLRAAILATEPAREDK